VPVIEHWLRAREAISQRETGCQRETAASAKAKKSDTLVLIAPLASEFVYLVDAAGEIQHQWKFAATGNNAYLFPDGTLMRHSQEPEIKLFDGRGSAGRIQKVDWDGNVLWDFKYASESHLQHHDFELLPNGNVLLIAWEKISKADALAAGRSAQKLEGDELYGEKIVEIQPEGKTGGKEVWVWRLRDHLIQHEDPNKPHYGKPAQHPRRVDINYAMNGKADWIHMNAVDYHPELDQIVLSARYFDELWFIDHSTTSQEAASSSGGRYGHGGDLLYRLGNHFAGATVLLYRKSETDYFLAKTFGAKRNSHGGRLGASPKPRDFLGMAPVDQVRLILAARSVTMSTAG
jgi:hypothetical protein